jgi:hypothetical protein
LLRTFPVRGVSVFVRRASRVVAFVCLSSPGGAGEGGKHYGDGSDNHSLDAAPSPDECLRAPAFPAEICARTRVTKDRLNPFPDTSQHLGLLKANMAG